MPSGDRSNQRLPGGRLGARQEWDTLLCLLAAAAPRRCLCWEPLCTLCLVQAPPGHCRHLLTAAGPSQARSEDIQRLQELSSARPSSLRAPPAAMASILDRLPAPNKQYERPAADQAPAAANLAVRGLREPPPYGKRKGFVPRRLEDFGDGEAAARGAAAPRALAAPCPPPPASPSLQRLPARRRRLPRDRRGAVPAGHGPAGQAGRRRRRWRRRRHARAHGERRGRRELRRRGGAVQERAEVAADHAQGAGAQARRATVRGERAGGGGRLLPAGRAADDGRRPLLAGTSCACCLDCRHVRESDVVAATDAAAGASIRTC